MNFVTGGTGFVGAHLVRALLAKGERVRCLVRPSSRRENLAGLPVELVEGDLTRLESLLAAVDGCEVVFHCAADYRLYAQRPEELYQNNVEGTRKLLQACEQAGVKKVVYTSTVGALGPCVGGRPADERTPSDLAQMIGHYKRSKFLAEREADAFAARGLPVVIVNPSTPVGELDLKPTPTGQVIVDFLSRRIPAYVESGLNLVDVRDVAQGHLLAAAQGKRGERYILGNRNLSLKEVFELLSSLTGIPAPKVKLPHFIPLGFAAASTAMARLTGKVPRVSVESVRMSRKRMFFDPGKAVRELGLPQTPVEEPLFRAIAWFKAMGYVRP
ncbi:MAG: hopanoid-associated sugar epimerase [Myxococcaceae bacterium]